MSDSWQVSARVLAGLMACWLVVKLCFPEQSKPLYQSSCRFVVVVDGQLVCDDEAPHDLSEVCSRSNYGKPIHSGDSLVSKTVCSQPHPQRGGPGWDHMPEDQLASLEVPIRVNMADEEELRSLPGVGPVLAQRIAEARPFRNIDQLLAVKGIGPVKLERMKNRLIVP